MAQCASLIAPYELYVFVLLRPFHPLWAVRVYQRQMEAITVMLEDVVLFNLVLGGAVEGVTQKLCLKPCEGVGP
jgi:hypothetical protein